MATGIGQALQALKGAGRSLLVVVDAAVQRGQFLLQRLGRPVRLLRSSDLPFPFHHRHECPRFI